MLVVFPLLLANSLKSQIMLFCVIFFSWGVQTISAGMSKLQSVPAGGTVASASDAAPVAGRLFLFNNCQYSTISLCFTMEGYRPRISHMLLSLGGNVSAPVEETKVEEEPEEEDDLVSF